MSPELLLKSIGLSIKRIRKGKKMTIQELADMCNFESSNMSRIEAGRNNLTIKTLHKISKALGVTIAQIVDVENQKDSSSGRGF